MENVSNSYYITSQEIRDLLIYSLIWRSFTVAISIKDRDVTHKHNKVDTKEQIN